MTHARSLLRQMPKSYNQSLSEWLPQGALERMKAGDPIAERLVRAYRRYGRYRKPEDWQKFVEARREFCEGG